MPVRGSAHDSTPPRRRVAVTGIGVVTPVGSGRETFWRALLAGESGIAPVSSFDTSRFKVRLGAEVRGFDPAPWCQRLDPQQLGRASQMAVWQRGDPEADAPSLSARSP